MQPPGTVLVPRNLTRISAPRVQTRWNSASSTCCGTLLTDSRLKPAKAMRACMTTLPRGGGGDGAGKTVDDLVDFLGLNDIGRCQQHMIAMHPVDGAAHRIAHQPSRHRLFLDPGVNAKGRIERRLAVLVRDKLDSAKQASPPDIADMGGLT